MVTYFFQPIYLTQIHKNSIKDFYQLTDKKKIFVNTTIFLISNFQKLSYLGEQFTARLHII